MIRSFIGTSLIEYPGKISSVIFVGGCNLYCPFCHNPELVKPDVLAEQYSIPHDLLIHRLEARKDFIEGVSITGGEPLLYPEILDFILMIKNETGLKIKLDTNGTLPSRLSPLLEHLDYVAMDIKASPGIYPKATGGKAVFEDILESVDMVKTMDEYEFRTTMVPDIVTGENLVEILERIKPVKKYVLQPFQSHKTLSPEFTDKAPYSIEYMRKALEKIRRFADVTEMRM